MKINSFLKLSIFLFVCFFLLKITINNEKAKILAETYLPNKIKTILKIIIKDQNYTKRFYNDYNTKFLPDTQFADVNFERIKLNFLSRAEANYFQNLNNQKVGYIPFFIESLNNQQILITDTKANFYIFKNYQNKSINSKDYNKINDNLESYKVLDTFIFENNLFVSFIKLENECKTFNISYAEFNKDNLDFKKLFVDNKCGKWIQGGRMQYLKHEEKKGIIFSIADNVADKPNNDPQDENSFNGKIIFISFDKSLNFIYSKGHRNPQGLFTDNNLILSTEHGPRGGDEINKIEFNKNYGWPISSYGKKYKKNTGYSQNHKQHGFKEPIYAFIPSIGISELIKVPNNFIDDWKNNFLLTSLKRGSIYRVKFSDNYERLIFAEEIFVGQRIRDIKYQDKKIFLALETKGELGILSTNFD